MLTYTHRYQSIFKLLTTITIMLFMVLPVAADNSLLLNPGLEETPPGIRWYFSKGEGASEARTENASFFLTESDSGYSPYEGTYMWYSSADDRSTLWQNMNLSAQSDAYRLQTGGYYVDFGGYVIDTDTADISISLHQVDSDGHLITAEFLYADTYNSWTSLSGSVEIDPSATFLAYYVTGDRDTNTSTKVYFDNGYVTLKEYSIWTSGDTSSSYKGTSDWDAGSNFKIGITDNGSLNISNGAKAEIFQCYVGESSGSEGTLTVDGAGTLLQLSGLGTYVGNNGAGNLEITNGGTAEGSAVFLGYNSGSYGTATVDGEGSKMETSLIIGHYGTGSLEILNGGYVKSRLARLSDSSGSSSTVTVDGEGSLWDITTSLNVGGSDFHGAGGTSTLTVKNGGTVNVGGLIKVWNYGNIFLEDGSIKTNTLDISVASGFNFTGGNLEAFNITGNLINEGGTLSPGASPGLLTIEGNYTQKANAFLEIKLGGLLRGDEFDALNVTGTLELEGTLDVIWYDNFTASSGDTFDILGWSILSGTFDLINLPDLDNGLSWDISNLYTDGSIFVKGGSQVPVPASILLLGSAIAVLAGFRRKTEKL